MDREKAAELAKTLDAAPDLAVDDAMDLRKLTTPLEEISDRLAGMSGELGVSGKVADAADEQILEIVRRLKAHADVVVDAATVAQTAAGIVSRAQTDYYQLPSGQLSAWERQKYEDAGAAAGLPYIEAAVAQQRETEADKALAALASDLADQKARMASLAEKVEEYRVPEDDGSTPGGRTPSTIPTSPYRPPGGTTPPPGGVYPGDPVYIGHPNPNPDPNTDPNPDPDPDPDPDPNPDPNPDPDPDPNPDPNPNPNPTDPGDGPGGWDPNHPGDGTTPPWEYGDGDVHSDGPGSGTPYGPGPIGGPNPNLGGGIGNGGAGNGNLPGGTAPGGGGVIGGGLAGGLAVGGTALGAVGGSRLSGGAGAGGLGSTPGTLGGGAVMAGPMGAGVGGGGAGGAAAGRAGGATGMVGGGAGGAGGAGSSSKKKRAGSLGYIAPELEDEEAPVERAAGLRRGSREDRPDVVAVTIDDDETW
jgi:hypothetical protein